VGVELGLGGSMFLDQRDISVGGFEETENICQSWPWTAAWSAAKKESCKGPSRPPSDHGHVTVEETDIAVGCAGKNFDGIGALANLPDDVFLGLGGGGARRPAWPAGALVVTIFGTAFVSGEAVATVFVEGLAAAAGGAGGSGLSLQKAVTIRLAATKTSPPARPIWCCASRTSAATITGAMAAKPEKA
jgi:hypothetical protein